MNERKLKSNRGITMSVLIVTIVLIFIVTGSSVYMSLDRFEVNKLNKMYNDIELLSDKTLNYYSKYNNLPLVKDNENNAISYTYSTLEFDKDVNDNGNYYILDLSAMEGISLNFGKDGFENPNTSDDVYIINEGSHSIYYVKGIKVDGKMYHAISKDESSINDAIPPSKPEIKIISGKKELNGIYTTEVELEIVPGNDNWSGVSKTTYSINGGEETEISTLTNNILPITEDGTYEIKARSYDANGNISDYCITTFTIKLPEVAKKPIKGDFVEYDVEYTERWNYNYIYTKTNGWRLIDYIDNGDGTYSNVKFISTGMVASFNYNPLEVDSYDWVVKEEKKLEYFKKILRGNQDYIFYTGTDPYYALQFAAGFYYNFEDIKFSYNGVGAMGATFTSVTTEGITYDEKNNVEKTGRELFNLYEDKATVRMLTLPEINEAVGRTDRDSIVQISEVEDKIGLYRLDQLKKVDGMSAYIYDNNEDYYCYGVASTYLDDNSFTSTITYKGIYNSSLKTVMGVGIRPVVCISSSIRLEDKNEDGVWEVKF